MINLHGLIEALTANHVWYAAPKKKLSGDYDELRYWLIDGASKATCFHMGHVEDVPQIQIINELFSMPYQASWFEATNNNGILGVLVREIEHCRLECAVFNKLSGVVWQVCCVVDIHADENNDIRCLQHYAYSREEEDNEEAHIYANHAINLVARFVMAINCSNTELVEHAAPKLLNKKRIAKGKQPLLSYWTVHLPSNGGASESKGGTHASPRLHLRRGHVRQYAPGKYTWVTACMVGSAENGAVVKDYDGKNMRAKA